MRKGTKVRVIDPSRSEFLLEGVIMHRCAECKRDGHVAFFVRLGDGPRHFLADQVKEVRG